MRRAFTGMELAHEKPTVLIFALALSLSGGVGAERLNARGFLSGSWGSVSGTVTMEEH